MVQTIAVCVSSFLAIGLLLRRQRESRAFDDRWPPIDDDEFIRRCRVGVSRDVALRTRRIVAEQLGIRYEQVYPEQHFVHDLHCD